jgi:MFS transporter, ACDE family, multidrug resistance protein
MKQEEKVYRNLNFQIVSLTSLMGYMMVVMVTPAFPAMVAGLNVSEQSIGLVITAMTLPALVLTPLGGMLADRFGRKKVLVPAVILYGAAGGCCAFAPDFTTLLILRLIQGIGAAPIFNVGQVILSDLFFSRQRAEAMGLNITVNYSGYIIFPILGGVLAVLSWQYTFLPFFLSVPLGICAWFLIKYQEPRNRQKLGDYLGSTIGYIKDTRVIWLFLAAMMTYIIFFGGYLTYFSLLLADRFQASPVIIGLLVSVVGLVISAVATQAGRLIHKYSPAAMIAASFLGYATAMFITPLMPDLWWCLLPTLIIGIAHGLNSPSLQLMAANITPPENRAGLMSLYSTMINLGMTLAPLVTGLAFTASGLNFDITFIACGIISLLVPAAFLAPGFRKILRKDSGFSPK